MGVPAFFRWLSKKYVSVIVPCIEEKPKELNGITIPVDATKENPNGVEFDNLYLDMNGIIHPCTHPEDKPAPKNEDEMMVAIFDCIDRLFTIVRPRKLLYMAIDGVAPRAKMNQQRSRRFRTAKESVEKIEEVARLRSELAAKGCFLPPEKPRGEHFDSNCITPGTPFMDRLSTCLHYYVHDRMNTNPAWKGIKVILSDANVPGEGEHKIMDYIRRQRAQPDHDPNTQHCLCGADADLIMLGLATHEPYFTIIREEFKPNKPKPCDICAQMGHEMKDCCGLERPVDNENIQPDYGAEGEFIFVRLNILREYLEKELDMPNLPFKFDFERAIDDWVFMCFFVGNDFLPHLPSLEIREGAIDRLLTLYKKAVYKTGGFLTNSGDVELDRVQLIMADLGEVEDQIFKKRQQDEIAFKARMKAKNKRMKAVQNFRPNWVPQGQYAPMPLGRNVNPIQNPRQAAYEGRMDPRGQRGGDPRGQRSGFGFNSQDNPRGQKRKADEMDSDEEEEPHDEVRLWEDGFKERYYESKFDVDASNIKFRHKLALEYVRGLCWVLRYYYQGCASWKWFFPYHYAPFASDFQDIGDLPTTFERGTKPFQPLQQLMGVFPATSSSHVPAPWATLMSSPDSPIIDFYPEDFKIDLNGKKFAWQGVALLPFVEEARLFKALEPFYDSLTRAEIRRNIRGDDRLYVTPGNSGYHFIQGLYENEIDFTLETEILIDGMRGAVLLAEDCVNQGGSLSSPVTGLPVVGHNIVTCIRFRDPKYSEAFIFPAKRLKGSINPPRVLKPQDLTPKQNRDWRPQIGMAPATKRASLGDAGHRMLGHHQRSPGSGIYSSVPPLMNNPSFNGAMMVQQLSASILGGNLQSGGQQQYGGQWHGSGYGSNQTSGSGYGSNQTSGSGLNSNRNSGGGYDFNRSSGGSYDSGRNSTGRYDSNRDNTSGRYDSNRDSTSGRYDSNRDNSGGRYNSNRSSIGSYSSDRSRGGGFDSARSSSGSYDANRNSTGGYDARRASGGSTYESNRSGGVSTYESNRSGGANTFEPNRSGGANTFESNRSGGAISSDSNRYTARTPGGAWSSSPSQSSGSQRGSFGGNQLGGEDLYSRSRSTYGGRY